MRIGLVAATLAASLMCGAAALAAPPGGTKATPTPLVAVDAAGRTVGRMLNGYFVLVTANGVQSALQVDPRYDAATGATDQALLDAQSLGSLFFTTPDCTGTVYVADNNIPGFRTGIGTVVNGVKYLYVPTTTRWTIFLVNSTRNWDGAAFVCTTSSFNVRGYPATPVPLSGILTEPMTIQ